VLPGYCSCIADDNDIPHFRIEGNVREIQHVSVHKHLTCYSASTQEGVRRSVEQLKEAGSRDEKSSRVKDFDLVIVRVLACSYVLCKNVARAC